MNYLKDMINIKEINIETHNTCTRKCPYCKFGLKREFDTKFMDEFIFEKILYDLKEMRYSQLIGPFVNNEPLLDKRMPTFIKMISTIVPSARSYLFTNGDLINNVMLNTLFDAGLSYIVISVHTPELISEFYKMVEHYGSNRVKLYEVYKLDKKKDFHNRGGSIQSPIVNQQTIKGGCFLPFQQIVINPWGDVFLCCCDFYYEVVIDNVLHSSLEDIIYNNKKFNDIRNSLSKSRKGLRLCEKCSAPTPFIINSE